MNPSLPGKELLLAALRHQDLPATPWLPFAGVHAGKLTGASAITVLTDEDALVAALLETNRLYDPDGQPVLFDLQVEAEILGCALVWAEGGPPTVADHPLAGGLERLNPRLPEPGDGRLPLILSAMRRVKAAVGERTALYGLLCGPMTLASHLRGTEIFMDMFDNPAGLADLLAFCRDVALRMADLYQQAGMDVIAVVDPLVSQVSPRHFTRFLDAPYRAIFDTLRAAGVFSSLFVCGDATKNLPVMCATGPDSLSIDENIDLPAAKAITDTHNITIGGNIPLTTRMLLGSQPDNMQFVVDLLEQLGSGVPRNFILAPGCDMPYDTPPENVVAVLQAVRDPAATRAMLGHYQSRTFADIPVELPDYAALPRPLIEVFTLDSDTCAACGYMLNAAQRAAAELAGQVDLVEYKFTSPENIARVMKMGIKNLPSLYINGELAYSSLIPSNRELLAQIVRQMQP